MSKEYKNKEVLVIDLGSYSIKILTGKVTQKGVMVMKNITIPISSGIYGNGDVQNTRELSSILQDAIREHGLKGHPVIFTISSIGSSARVLEVPTVKPSEMKEVIDYEMQQYLPADVSAFITQYRPLSDVHHKTDFPSKMLVGTVPKVLAENLLAIAKDCELIPMALDMHPNALIKLLEIVPGLNMGEKLSNMSVAFIDLGHTLMDISIFEKGDFQFHRRIMMGGKNIDQRIERVLDVSADDARMEKHNNSDINRDVFDYTDENRVFNSVKTGVDEWVDEIEKVVKFYVSRKNGNRLDYCYIYGGGSGFAGIERYLSNALVMPVEVIRELQGLSDVGLGKEKMPLFINALGALIRKEEPKK